jgi:hypothetical protein
MRYRNIEPLSVKRGRGNIRTSAIGRDTRTRLFDPSELASPFEPDMRRAVVPTLTVEDETFPHESARTEQGPKELVAQMPDLVPVNVLAQDHRNGGRDEFTARGPSPVRRAYSSDADTVDRELDVVSPTAANVAQVLNALLGDMSRESVVVRK